MQENTALLVSTSILRRVTDPHRLARVHLKRCADCHATLRFWRAEWWSWNGTRYKPLGDLDLRAHVTATVKSEFDSFQAQIANAPDMVRRFRPAVTRSVTSNVIQALESLALVAESVEQPDWLGSDPVPAGGFLAMANGLVSLAGLLNGDQNVIMDHSANWFSPICLPYAYDPAATCPQWLHTLDVAFEHDTERIKLAQEWFGYCSRHDTSFQKFLLCVGEGGNGKTVFTDVLTAFLGEDNVSNVPLELFAERFQLTSTLGKLANIASDMGEIDRVAEGHLKAFISGDRMHFDRKFLAAMQARPTARLVFATNNLPQFSDRSSGLWRRMILLPFRVQIPPAQQDPHLIDKLKLELPGVFNWGIEGLGRLRQQNRFTIPSVCSEALEAFKMEINPARVFLLEHVSPNPGGQVRCSVLYEAYRKWCQTEGCPALSNAQLGKEVKRVLSVERRRLPGAGHVARPWVYKGLVMATPAAECAGSEMPAVSSQPTSASVPAVPVSQHFRISESMESARRMDVRERSESSRTAGTTGRSASDELDLAVPSDGVTENFDEQSP